MAPSAGSLCFPPTADFHPCSPRGAGVGVGKAGQSGRPQQSGRPRPLTGACPRSTGACRGTGGGSGGKGVRQPGRAPCVLVGHRAERQERSSMACSEQAWVSLTWAVPDAEQPIHSGRGVGNVPQARDSRSPDPSWEHPSHISLCLNGREKPGWCTCQGTMHKPNTDSFPTSGAISTSAFCCGTSPDKCSHTRRWQLQAAAGQRAGAGQFCTSQVFQ